MWFNLDHYYTARLYLSEKNPSSSTFSLSNPYINRSYQTAPIYSTYTNREINTILLKKLNAEALKEAKTVCFDPTSTYPRYKLRELTSLTKVLNPQKANVYIIGNEVFNSRVYRGAMDLLLLRSDSQDKTYRAYASRTYDGRHPSTPITEEEIIKYLLTYQSFPEDLKVIYSGHVHSMSLEEAKLAEIIMSEDEWPALVTDQHISEYVSKYQRELTEEEASNINKMLQSKDPAIVEMGIKLLCSYNPLEYACAIGILIKKNGYNILQNKGRNSVAFKNLLQTYGIALADLSNLVHSSNNVYLARFYSISTSAKDKAIARLIVKEYIKKHMIATFNSMNYSMEEFNIQCEITVK